MSTLLTRIVVASALPHFYFDGLIWRMRQGHFHQRMGFDSDGNGAGPWSPGSGSHALKWLLLLVPAAFLGFREAAVKAANELDMLRNLSSVAPGSWGM